MLPALLGGALFGPAAGALTMGVTSGGTEFGNSLLDYAQENGVDTKNADAVKSFLSDPEKLKEGMVFAGKRGGIIGALDTATGGIASKTLAPKAVTGALARQAINVPAQMGVQMAGGAGGEALGQLATRGEITQPGAVLMEAIGELGGAPAEVAAFSKEIRDSISPRRPPVEEELAAIMNPEASIDDSIAAANAAATADSELDRLAAAKDEYLAAAPGVTPAPAAVGVERTRQLVDQMGPALAADQASAAEQLRMAQGNRAAGASATEWVDTTPMAPLQARQQLAVLQEEAARPGTVLQVVAHPTQSGALAIRRVPLPTAEPAGAAPVSAATAQNRIETAALTGSEAARRATPEEQGRQAIVDRALRSIEARGGVASPYEAQVLRESNSGKPYDRIDPALAAPLSEAEKLTQATGIAVGNAPREQVRTTPQAEAAAAEKAGVAQKQQSAQERANEASMGAFEAGAPARAQAAAVGQKALQDAADRPPLPPPVEAVVAASRVPPFARTAEQKATLTAARVAYSAPDLAAITIEPALRTQEQRLAVERLTQAKASPLRDNGSGESIASLEDQGRVAEEKKLGRTRVLVNADGTSQQLSGVGAVDQRARAGQVIVQLGVGAQPWTALEQGPGTGKSHVARAIAIAQKNHTPKASTLRGAERAVNNTNVFTRGEVEVDPATLPSKSARTGLRTKGLTKQAHTFVSHLASLYGKRVVVFRGANVDGFFHPSDPDTLYLNADSTKPHLVVFGHELLHSLKESSPAAYDKLHNAIRAQLKEGADKAFAKDYGESADTEELISDLVGNRMQEPEFWAGVFKDSDAAEVSRLGASIISALNAIKKTVGKMTGFKTDELVKDLDAVKVAVTTAMRTMAQERRGAARKLAAEGGVATPRTNRESTEVSQQSSEKRVGSSDKPPPPFANGEQPRAPDGKWVAEDELAAAEEQMKASARRAQTDTPEFKRWFGDSKVVDENGEPLVVYHSTQSDFSTFERSRDIGFHFGTAAQANTRATANRGWESEKLKDNTSIMPVYLSIKNPVRLKDQGDAWVHQVPNDLYNDGLLSKAAWDTWRDEGNEKNNWKELTPKLIQSLGYDGAVYYNTKEEYGDSYIAFRPEQIKSAISNSGAFDLANPDIRKSPQRTDLPQYGTPTPNSISVTGVHYSKEPRDILNSVYAGMGLKGADNARLEAEGGEKKRIYFYVEKGRGVVPEAGVGGYAHSVQLNNLYDAVVDPLHLAEDSAGATQFEQAVTQNGFDGYYQDDFRKDVGAAVLLGQHKVSTKQTGQGAQKPTGAMPQRAKAPERTGWRKVVSDLRDSEQLPAGALPIARWASTIQREAPALYAAMQPTGVFNSTASDTLYRNDLIKAYREAFANAEKRSPARREINLRGLAAIERHLTEQERDELSTASAKTLIASFAQLPPADQFAAAAWAGRAKRGWYRESAKAIARIFGPDAPRFAALLAAMSPQNSVQTNLENTLHTWKNWVKAGRPTSRARIVSILGESVQGDKGKDSVLDAWVNNSVHALTDQDPGNSPLSGPKVDSFMRNLLGNVEEVTNDAWMANFAYVDQKLFAGTGRLFWGEGERFKVKIGRKAGGYLAMSVRVREAAERLTELTGETWTPAEVQETIWSWAKTLYEMQNEERGSARDILYNEEMTDAMIRSTPDFRGLFHDAKYAAILEDAGYGDRLRELDLPTDPSEEPGAGVEAEPFDSATQSRLLNASAGRLEELKASGKPTEEVAEDYRKKVKRKGSTQRATLQDFTPERLPDLLNKTDWAILTASDPGAKKQSGKKNAEANAKLEKDLQDAGYDYVDAVGKYGDTQPAYIIVGLDGDASKALGQKYGQESVLTRDGLVYSDGRPNTPTTGTVTVYEEAPEDFYTTIPGTETYFQVGLDFEAGSKASPRRQQESDLVDLRKRASILRSLKGCIA
jgi:hypothetical protein